MARVVLAQSARNAVAALDDPLLEAVVEALDVLEREPYSGRRLRGRLEGLWSLPVGAYRVIYRIRDGVVHVVAIRARAETDRPDTGYRP